MWDVDFWLMSFLIIENVSKTNSQIEFNLSTIYLFILLIKDSTEFIHTGLSKNDLSYN